MVAGKTIYFTESQLEMIYMAFDYGNVSYEGRQDEEERENDREEILRKVSK